MVRLSGVSSTAFAKIFKKGSTISTLDTLVTMGLPRELGINCFFQGYGVSRAAATVVQVRLLLVKTGSNSTDLRLNN